MLNIISQLALVVAGVGLAILRRGTSWGYYGIFMAIFGLAWLVSTLRS